MTAPIVHPFPIARHPLGPIEATALCDDLAAAHIRVAVRLGETVHLTAIGEITTEQEVTAIGAFKGVTDQRVDWHKADVLRSIREVDE